MDDGKRPRDGAKDRAPDAGPRPEPQHADPQQLARDWITLWQSELSAASVDREVQETWQAMAGLWAGAAAAMLQGLPRGAPDAGVPSGRAGAVAAARPAATAAASDPRDAEIDRLARRIAELERRLADLERGG